MAWPEKKKPTKQTKHQSKPPKNLHGKHHCKQSLKKNDNMRGNLITHSKDVGLKTSQIIKKKAQHAQETAQPRKTQEAEGWPPVAERRS